MGWLQEIFGATPKVWPTSVNDTNFQREVLESDVPVLVDFWGESCAPCKALEPVIVDLATDYAGRLKVCEVNAAAAPETCAKYGISGTPTVLYFKKGRQVDRIVGFRGSLYHRELIDKELLQQPVRSEAPRA